MSWSIVTVDWPVWAACLAEDFECLDQPTLEGFRGDRAKVVDCLAAAHDLTQAEAFDTLEVWLGRRSRHMAEARVAA
ncbi:hypothetical protein [Roseisalinus antarcticus]|uniref:Uncharacterized protein n=1 Tax=Roseisalinus antarcticus TaxID=254357 RepID=A0A1Y5TBK5_9RHOB|nr:hypothetical protein [Roseisalinus antarcticus]SLN60334.1 hypothetical protein ROA7023_02797 [Roseisalinus antarcticus]